MYNFEKYMMTKPDAPTIILNDSDKNDNADNLFGVNTATKIKEELRKVAKKDEVIKPSDLAPNKTNFNDSHSDSSQSTTAHDLSDIDDIEIIFEDVEPTLEDASIDGGAITETYETPAIKRNEKNNNN